MWATFAEDEAKLIPLVATVNKFREQRDKISGVMPLLQNRMSEATAKFDDAEAGLAQANAALSALRESADAKAEVRAVLCCVSVAQLAV